jgi:hypothetical protein
MNTVTNNNTSKEGIQYNKQTNNNNDNSDNKLTYQNKNNNLIDNSQNYNNTTNDNTTDGYGVSHSDYETGNYANSGGNYGSQYSGGETNSFGNAVPDWVSKAGTPAVQQVTKRTKYGKFSWQYMKTVTKRRDTIKNAGRYLQTKARSNTLGLDMFSYDVKGYSLQVDGSRMPNASTEGYGRHSAVAGMFSGIDAIYDAGPSPYGNDEYEWDVGIPNQAPTHGNSAGHTLDVWTDN